MAKKYRILTDLMYLGKILPHNSINTLEGLKQEQRDALEQRGDIIDVEKYVEEIGIKDEAAQIIADAKIEASKIIAEAKAEADKIRSEAKQGKK